MQIMQILVGLYCDLLYIFFWLVIFHNSVRLSIFFFYIMPLSIVLMAYLLMKSLPMNVIVPQTGGALPSSPKHCQRKAQQRI